MTIAMSHTETARSQQVASPGAMLASQASFEAIRLPVPVLIYVLCVIFPLSFNVGPLVLTTLRLMLLVLIVPMTLRLLAGKYGKVFITDIVFLLHIVWAGVALAVNNPEKVIQQTGSVGIEFIGGYVLARAYIRTPEAFIALCRLLLVMVMILLPFSLLEAVTGRVLLVEILDKIPGLGTVRLLHTDQRLGLDRVQNTFAHPIHYGLFCSVVFSLCFVGLKGVLNGAARTVCSGLVLGAGFLALSSGALSALALQLGLIVWAAVFAAVRQRWWFLVALFVLAYIVIDLLSNRTPIRVFMHYMTFSAHTGYWRILIFEWGMVNVWANPIFGLGLNDWVRPAFMYSGSMDNFWLVMAVRYGIPGFVLLAIGYVVAIARVMRRNFEDDPRLSRLRRAWVFTFLGLSFVLCTVHVWGNLYSFVFFMFGAGLWLITYEPNTPDDSAAQDNATPAPAALHNRPEAELAYTRVFPQADTALRDPTPLPQRDAPAPPRATATLSREAETKERAADTPRYTRF